MTKQDFALLAADCANLQVIASKIEELHALMQRALDTAQSRVTEEALTDFINEMPPLVAIKEAIRNGHAG